jgi:hypothetical protein
VTDTWDEVACRARLAVADGPSVIACRELGRHAADDLRAALAEIDRLREIVRGLSERVAAQSDLLARRAEGCLECDRLRATLLPFAAFARFEMDPARLPTVADFEAAAAALGGRP